MRKEPTQARAKQRVSRILDATETLIVEEGVGNLTVNSIAARAEVPIGSLYQYFTNRDEVLRAVCARHFHTLESRLGDTFAEVASVADFLRGVRTSLMACWDYTRDNESFRCLFFDIQAWKVLREADLEDTFANAQRMSSALRRLVPHVPAKRVLALCVLVGDAASGTARLAARFDDMQDELFAEFLELVESRIYTMLRDDAVLERNLDQDVAA